ncbi:MAG: hypothetical protein FWE23_04340 [Chitinivibrionia bacterium]|nr:hypothetical protein [Chitinivibrionia bacterium]
MPKIALFFVWTTIAFAQFNENELRTAASIHQNIDERRSAHFTTTRQRGTQPRYFVCNCENFNITFDKGLAVLQNYTDYENRFQYILRSQNTEENFWFFVLGINFVRTWLWGEVKEEIGEDEAKISFIQSESDINFSDSVKAMMVINFEELILQWNLIRLSDTSSRFCLTAAAVPNSPVPQWLIRAALRRIIPRTLRAIAQ